MLNNKKLKTKKKNVSKYADTKFNPFEHGKIKLPKKKIKEDLNYKEGNKNNTESSDELNQENEKKINDYDLKHFYERMLKEENINENNLTPKDVQQQIKCAEPEKCLLKENKVDECFLSHKDINTTGSRIKKKENPCLLAPSEIK